MFETILCILINNTACSFPRSSQLPRRQRKSTASARSCLLFLRCHESSYASHQASLRFLFLPLTRRAALLRSFGTTASSESLSGAALCGVRPRGRPSGRNQVSPLLHRSRHLLPQIMLVDPRPPWLAPAVVIRRTLITQLLSGVNLSAALCPTLTTHTSRVLRLALAIHPLLLDP